MNLLQQVRLEIPDDMMPLMNDVENGTPENVDATRQSSVPNPFGDSMSLLRSLSLNHQYLPSSFTFDSFDIVVVDSIQNGIKNVIPLLLLLISLFLLYFRCRSF